MLIDRDVIVVVRASPPDIARVAEVQGWLPAIFRAATPNRPYFVRNLTATVVTAALDIGARTGSHVWLDPADIALATFTSSMQADIEANTLGRGLLFVGAAVRARTEISKGRCLIQLDETFARIFDADLAKAERQARIAAFQTAVRRETGLDVTVQEPSYD